MPEITLNDEPRRNWIFQNLFEEFVKKRNDPERYRELVEKINALPNGYKSLPVEFGAGLEAISEGHGLTKGMESLGSYSDPEKGEVQLFVSDKRLFELTVDPEGNNRLTLIRQMD
jgi:hypothetical protein